MLSLRRLSSVGFIRSDPGFDRRFPRKLMKLLACSAGVGRELFFSTLVRMSQVSGVAFVHPFA